MLKNKSEKSKINTLNDPVDSKENNASADGFTSFTGLGQSIRGESAGAVEVGKNTSIQEGES